MDSTKQQFQFKEDKLKYELKKYLNNKLTYPLKNVEDINVNEVTKIYGSRKPSEYLIQLEVTGQVDNRTIRRDK